MPSSRRLESLRRKLVKINRSENLESLTGEESLHREGLESFSFSPALDVIAPAPPALLKLKNRDFADLSGDETTALEAIVEREGRPVGFIVGGVFEDLPDPWTHFNSGEIRKRLTKAIPLIGRVERLSPAGQRTDHVGTGFIVGPGLMMTNRHVAEVFVRGAGSAPLRFTPGGRFDFGRERGFDPLNLDGTLRVTGVRLVHPFWDMALLELADLPASTGRLTLSVLKPGENVGRDIAAIGYPGRGKDTSQTARELEEKYFQNIYGVKRIAPGDIDGEEETTSFAHTVAAMTHDCSTLAGNSGSAVVDAETGEVISLHFKGVTLKMNYSVPMHELARDRRVQDAGVEFNGSVPATDEWEPWWKAAAGDETLVRRRPTVFPGVVLPQSASPASREPRPAHGARDGVSTWIVPLRISISLDGAAPAVPAAGAAASAPAEESFQLPIMCDGLDTRGGYDPGFLELPDGEQVPLPALTAKGAQAVARQSSGEFELKYHHFSVVMHKARRLALFTASNVDWRKASREVAGHKPTRAELSGIPDGVLEQWATDERIGEDEQLPDVFFTRDNQAFDKGHLVRREDAAWGTSFEDIQMANGDTYFTTNCSPQVKEFNQASFGDFNWGDLENMIRKETRAEKVVIFSGPILSRQDRFFVGLTETGPTRVQIPQCFWKIVVARTDAGVKAFGFLPEQDLRDVPLEEFAVPEDWKEYQVPIGRIEDRLSGLVSLAWCKERDAHEG